MKKKLTYRDIQNNKIRMELMQKGGFSLLRNPNPKLNIVPLNIVPPTIMDIDKDGHIKSIGITGSLLTPTVRYYDDNGKEISSENVSTKENQ